MIERLYVHNFRCFENFTLDLKGKPSALIIGKNGSGKSTLRHALGVVQNICRGAKVGKCLDTEDFTTGRQTIPMRFECDLVLQGKPFQYMIAFDMPEKFREPRVTEERLTVNGEPVFNRKLSQVDLPGSNAFGLDWHVAALPVVNSRGGEQSIQQLRAFFASLLLLAPVPRNMGGFAPEDETELDGDAGNFAAWLANVVGTEPARYSDIVTFLKEAMPDFGLFKFVPRGEFGKQLTVRFDLRHADGSRSLSLDFAKLSDGEKCFFLSAAILAHNSPESPLFCFWDEPDNHLSLPEVGQFITELRKSTSQHGQFIATSHHPEAIRRFSDENTYVFTRNSHLEPTVVRPLTELPYGTDLVRALVRGEVI